MKTKLDFDEFKNSVQDFEHAIMIKPKDINSLKGILEKIAFIRISSHSMQIKMYQIRERVRTFFLYLDYKYLLENEKDKELVETMLEIKGIYNMWSKIVNLTYKKQEDMKEDNLVFSNQTRVKDKDFQTKVDEFHKSFMQRGPHSREVDIEEGLELYEDFMIRLQMMKETKEQIVKDQRLFDLPISK